MNVFVLAAKRVKRVKRVKRASPDNGGPVRTRAPFAVSPLIDKIPAGACTIATDARGIKRPQGSACDIGAVELVPVEQQPCGFVAIVSGRP
ncbi:MAG TPA: choice-of-anchor Q domain-containing protein [Polyangiaceae bacterium]